MSLSISFRGQARREFDEAADWYEQRRVGLGARFVAAVERVLDQAAVNPGRYAEVLEGVHEGLVHGFPYCVYFREEGDGRARRLADSVLPAALVSRAEEPAKASTLGGFSQRGGCGRRLRDAAWPSPPHALRSLGFTTG